MQASEQMNPVCIGNAPFLQCYAMSQVTIPVEITGRGVTSISILSLHKSDMRLLHLAAKLAPLIASAAQEVAVALAEEEAEHNEQKQASASGMFLISFFIAYA